MKAIRIRIQKSSRPLVILLAAVVAIITSAVVANATQTITTPNAAFISYNLGSDADTSPITPASNRAVLVMGVCTTAGGVGHVCLQHIPSNGGIPGVMTWTGFEPFNGALTTTTAGESNVLGAHIVYLDYNHRVAIQIASADTIIVHNGQSATMAGNVTLIW